MSRKFKGLQATRDDHVSRGDHVSRDDHMSRDFSVNDDLRRIGRNRLQCRSISPYFQTIQGNIREMVVRNRL